MYLLREFKQMAHSKIKNPAIIFELLLRRLTSDTINGKENSPALEVIREFFNKNTVLGKEYELYQILTRNKFSSETKANILLEQILSSRRTLNEKQLKKEKYGVIKKLREVYNIEEFFSTKLDLYKVYASIYKLFETTATDSPATVLKEKFTILENCISPKVSDVEKNDTIMESFEKENKDVRLLAYKFLVDKFNKKYSSQLDVNQKRLLKEYIYTISNTNTLTEYVRSIVPGIQKELLSEMHITTDKVTQIKLQETISMLDKLKVARTVKDENILSLLRYYDLLKEIKEVNHGKNN